MSVAHNTAAKLLKLSTTFWGLSIITGQLLFVVYISIFYGGSAIRGDWESWNKVFPRGYIEGDLIGNIVVAVHLGLAIIILIGGAIQLLPYIRSHYPALHRWNGRIYVGLAFTSSIAGLLMMLSRGAVGGGIQHLGLFVNALLIMLFAVMALKTAMQKNFYAHKAWAMRLFFSVSGVWFFRVMLMLWIVINQGPAGFNPETFEGPFLYFLSFATYLLPLAIHEFYLKATRSNNPKAHYIMAGALTLLTLAMIVGIIAAVSFMWLPRL